MLSHIKKLGPGLLFAGAAIGVSHLVQSTRAGADFGLGLLWALLLVHLFKYPFFQFGPRYAAATGESLLKGYHKLGKSILIAYFILSLATMFTIQAAVTIVTAGLANSLFGDISVLSRCPILQKNCRYLCLAQCPLVSGSFKSLEPMKKLNSILLGGCATLDCSEASDLLGNWAVSSKLECIGLSATSLTGSIEPLKALTSVNVLDLSGCNVCGKLEHLHTCNKLSFLNITGCQNIKGAEIFAKKHPACEILSGDF